MQQKLYRTVEQAASMIYGVLFSYLLRPNKTPSAIITKEPHFRILLATHSGGFNIQSDFGARQQQVTV